MRTVRFLGVEEVAFFFVPDFVLLRLEEVFFLVLPEAFLVFGLGPADTLRFRLVVFFLAEVDELLFVLGMFLGAS